jgi:serine/threonine-protein kinase
MLRFESLPERSHSLHTEPVGQAPDAFGPFRVLHQIGAGTLGPVFRAFDPEGDRLVAVKRFQLDVPPERAHALVADLERLVRAELTHPVMAAAIAAGLSGTAAYLATEYVSGDSLDVALREYGTAPPADTIRVAAQLASALDFAAVVGIHHGALHPRDVLLTSDDTRVTGIGIAPAIERIGVAAPIRRPYTAPERVAGKQWDGRADVFSLAALVFEMLWGKRPSGTGEAAADAVTELPGADLVALRNVFARALAVDPDLRFGTALEFAEAFRAAFPLVVVAPPARPARPSAAAARQQAGESAAGADVRPKPARIVQQDEPARLPLDDQEPPANEPAPVLSEEALSAFASEHVVSGPAEPAPAAGDFELHRAEESPFHEEKPPFEEIEAAAVTPAREEMARPATALHPEPLPASTAPHELPSAAQPEFLANAIEQSRSAVWPLALALGVGLAIGFAGGYGVGSHDRPAPLLADPVGTRAPAVPASPSREATDVAINDAPKPHDETSKTDVRPRIETPKATAADSVMGRAADQGGRLLVHSTPAGARVFVDGHEYGVTPLPVRDLSRGSHRVRIVREGYATAERQVLLTASRPSLTIAVPLTRAAQNGRAATSGAEPTPDTARAATPSTLGRFVGALTVESRPTGARVFIDGKLVGTTPLQVPEVTAGSHAVALEHDGYVRWSSSVRIVAAEKNRVTASLERNDYQNW